MDFFSKKYKEKKLGTLVQRIFIFKELLELKSILMR